MTYVHDRTDPVDIALIAGVSAWSVPMDLDTVRTPGPTGRCVRMRPGTWLARASVAGRLVGFALAQPVGARFPATHPRASALRTLGADRRDEWLAGALEIVELATVPHVARERVARSLAGVLVEAVPGRRAWILLDAHDALTAQVLQVAGWVRVGPADDGTGPATLLAPGHPAVRAGLARRTAEPSIPARWSPWVPPGRG